MKTIAYCLTEQYGVGGHHLQRCAVILKLIQREVNGPCSFGLLNANENTIYLWKLSV